MAEKIERQIIDVGKKTTTAARKPAAKTAAASKDPAKKKAKVQAAETHAIVTAENRSRAVKYRIGAVILWLVALGLEILTILVINGTLYIPGNILVYIIIGLALDMGCVILGSQLWKKANHIDPKSEKNKVGFFLWNNMGLIASLICFVPVIIFLLKEKDLDEKTKKIATIVAIVVALIAGGTSIDWNPVSAEDLAEAQGQAEEYTVDGSVYWTQWGKCYHLDENCQSLKNSATLYKGDVNEAFEARRSKPCSFCASEEALAQYKADAGLTGIIEDTLSDGDIQDTAEELLGGIADDIGFDGDTAEFAD